EHEIAGENETFSSMNASFTDSEPRILVQVGNGKDGIGETVQIKLSVLDTGVIRITQKVVHAIRIHLAGDEIAPQHGFLCAGAALNERGNFFRAKVEVGIERMVFNGTAQLR